MSGIGGPKPTKDKPTSLPPDQPVRERLQYNVRLAQELVDVRHAKVAAVVLDLSGERPPDPEGIEYLRSLTSDLEMAREALSDATCRYLLFSRKRAQPI
jgi:hypothetical protein